MARHLLIHILVALFALNVASGEPFFTIISSKWSKQAPKDGSGIWNDGLDKNTGQRISTYVPSMEVNVIAQQAIRSKNTIARIYYYDSSGKMIGQATPSFSTRSGRDKYAVPLIYPEKKRVSLYFAVPVKLPANFSSVVVFGDQYEVAARAYPDSPVARFEFPEKKLFLSPTLSGIVRELAISNVIEYPVKTLNPNQPQITLFVRFPKGAEDARTAKGVMAICVLANGLGEIRNMLHKMDEGEGLSWRMKFAEENQLAVVIWGARRLWDPSKNFDDLDKKTAREIDASFDAVAISWTRGIRQLGLEYGLPQQSFLLSGSSGAAQWAHRLALRNPEFFLAVNVHIPSSFDQPSLVANRVLWCLTTGELEVGYARSLRFMAECRRLGYPMIYKAYIGLGHQGTPAAENLGRTFFNYALGLAEDRKMYDLKNPLKAPEINTNLNPILAPWVENFKNPAFIADIINQEVYSAGGEKLLVPEQFQVALPNKELAEAWKHR